MTYTILCKRCRQPFTSSRTGATVNCPRCRQALRAGNRLATATGYTVAELAASVCRCGTLTRAAMLAGHDCPNQCHRASYDYTRETT